MRIGIDLGGTKTEIAVLDQHGDIQLRRREPTPRHDYEASLQQITDLVRVAEAELGSKATVGIATPGAISPASGLLRNANSTWLNDKPFDRDLEQRLGRQIRMANDADCFALSEASDGAGQDFHTVFGVILGTGVGGGIVINKSLLQGANAIAGEWGHNPLPWPQANELPGRQCYCGKQACIETFLSGPAFAYDYHRADFVESNGQGDPGGLAGSREIVERALAGDVEANAALDRYADRLARALASVINVIDPDVIVLGGGMSNVDLLYERVPGLLQQYVFSDAVLTRVVKNRHGDSSGVRGAAWLWPQ